MKNYCFFYIGKSKKEQRLSHWREIKNRVTSHEGEIISGGKGKDYKQKYSKKYLGVDLSAPTNFNKPEYQKELEKKK